MDQASLLDIGGGVGPIQHELFPRGLGSAIQVDASRAYIDVSRNEAEERGYAERVEYLYGDFVELVDEVPEADIVALDRVVCCYPFMERLVDASARKARRVYGLVYPRETWLTRLWLGVGNLFFRLSGSAFRTFIHPPARIDDAVRRNGFREIFRDRTFFWEVVTFAREVAR